MRKQLDYLPIYLKFFLEGVPKRKKQKKFEIFFSVNHIILDDQSF